MTVGVVLCRSSSCAQPIELTVGDLRQMRRQQVIGGQEDEQIIPYPPTRIHLVQAEGLPESPKLCRAAVRATPDPTSASSRPVFVDIVVVADEKVGRRGQRGEELPGERVLLRRPPVLADIAQDHDAIDIGPPIDGPEDRLLGRQVSSRKVRVAQDDQMVGPFVRGEGRGAASPGQKDDQRDQTQRRLAGLSVPNPIASLPSRPISQTPTSPSRPVPSRTSAAGRPPRPPGGSSPGRR